VARAFVNSENPHFPFGSKTTVLKKKSRRFVVEAVMILCIGEILVDVINEKTDRNHFSRFLGGAPFNVACAITKFGGDAGFIGNIGNDQLGSFLRQEAEKQNLKYLKLDVKDQRDTSWAMVEIKKDGERKFRFQRRNGADFCFDPKTFDFSIFDQADIIHLGSLMLSEKAGRDFFDRAIYEIKNRGKKFSFDINYRKGIFRSLEEAFLIYQNYIPLADILKYSEEELVAFAETSDYSSLLSKLFEKDQLVCLTLGNKGSAFFWNGITEMVPGIDVKPVDTTGAGDAFFGMILSKLEKMDLTALSKEKLQEIFRFGNIAGGLTTLSKGAIASLPSLSEINKYQ
jgi:fructokinase